MNCRKWGKISRIVSSIGGALFVVGFLPGNFWMNPITYIGLVLLVAGLVIAAVKFRCPECGKRLHEKPSMPLVCCPECGAELEA